MQSPMFDDRHQPHLRMSPDRGGDIAMLIEALHDAVSHLPAIAAPAVLAQLGALTLALGARLADHSGREPSEATAECLSLAALARRLGLGASTIRKMVDAGEFEEGVHFNRIRRRLIFFWGPIEQHIRTRRAAPPTAPVDAIPFERKGRCRG